MTTLSTLCVTGNLKCWTETGEECKIIFTARKRSLRRLCFFTGVCPIACWDTTPPAGTPLGRNTPRQVHPLGRHPLGRYTPRAETPLGSYTPLGRYTPWEGTPPAQCMLGYTLCTVHAGIHPPAQCMLGCGQQVGGTHPTGMHSC